MDAFRNVSRSFSASTSSMFSSKTSYAVIDALAAFANTLSLSLSLSPGSNLSLSLSLSLPPLSPRPMTPTLTVVVVLVVLVALLLPLDDEDDFEFIGRMSLLAAADPRVGLETFVTFSRRFYYIHTSGYYITYTCIYIINMDMYMYTYKNI